MICFSTSSPSGKYGTTVMRPSSAGLNDLSRSGRSGSRQPVRRPGIVSGSAHTFMIVSVPTFEVSRMIVFLKLTSLPLSSCSMPLSNTW